MPLPLSFVTHLFSCSQVPDNNQDKRTPCLRLNHSCSCLFLSAWWTRASSSDVSEGYRNTQHHTETHGINCSPADRIQANWMLFVQIFVPIFFLKCCERLSNNHSLAFKIHQNQRNSNITKAALPLFPTLHLINQGSARSEDMMRLHADVAEKSVQTYICATEKSSLRILMSTCISCRVPSLSVKITQNLKISTTIHKLHCLVHTDIYGSVTQGRSIYVFLHVKQKSKFSASWNQPIFTAKTHRPFRCWRLLV